MCMYSEHNLSSKCILKCTRMNATSPPAAPSFSPYYMAYAGPVTTKTVSWCFEHSQPLRNTSRLKKVEEKKEEVEEGEEEEEC